MVKRKAPIISTQAYENFKGEISLPIYPQLDEEQLNFIINVVKAAYITVAGTE